MIYLYFFTVLLTFLVVYQALKSIKMGLLDTERIYLSIFVSLVPVLNMVVMVLSLYVAIKE